MDHQISAKRPDLIIINKKKKEKKKKKKKRTCRIVDFAVPADHRIKLKECETKDKYLNLAREFKKLRNMKVTIIPIVIGAFGTVTKGLLKGLEDLEVGGWRKVETTQTKAMLRTAVVEKGVNNNNNKRQKKKDEKDIGTGSKKTDQTRLSKTTLENSTNN